MIADINHGRRHVVKSSFGKNVYVEHFSPSVSSFYSTPCSAYSTVTKYSVDIKCVYIVTFIMQTAAKNEFENETTKNLKKKIYDEAAVIQAIVK